MSIVRHRASVIVRTATVTAIAGALALVSVGAAAGVSAAPAPNDSGFNALNSGVVKYVPLAPTEATTQRQVNAPTGLKEAHRIASGLGFRKSKTFSEKQYAAYMAGKGVPPGFTKADARKAAQLTRLAVTYLGNTNGNSYTRIVGGEKVSVTLGSYGLMVDSTGMLRVPANCPDPASSDFSKCSPVRLINWVLAPDVICDDPDNVPPPGIPCGYMGAWMRHNKAKDTLKELYRSAYLPEVPYASKSQEQALDTQLIYVNKAGAGTQVVGVPVAPAMWLLNFLLIYALSPTEGAKMPAAWVAIPDEVVSAIEASVDGPTPGQVPYVEYMEYFTR